MNKKVIIKRQKVNWPDKPFPLPDIFTWTVEHIRHDEKNCHIYTSKAEQLEQQVFLMQPVMTSVILGSSSTVIYYIQLKRVRSEGMYQKNNSDNCLCQYEVYS